MTSSVEQERTTVADDGEAAARPLSIGARLARGVRPLPLALLVLVVVEPLLGFANRNRDEYLQLDILLQLGLLALAVVLVAYLVLLVALPRVEPVRIAAPLTAFAFCFFRYGAVVGESQHPVSVTLAAWAAVTALAVVGLVLWSRHSTVCLFLVVFLAIMTLQPAIQYASSQAEDSNGAAPALASSPTPVPVSDQAVRTPDVWWLLFDEYGRADSLEALLDLDNGPFLDQLDQRGFDVSEDSYSSYPVTALSISSVLEMDYVATESTGLPAGAYGAAGPLREGGRAVDALQEHDYRYLYADNGVFDWSQCEEDLVDVCIDAPRSGPDWGHLTRTVADLTPLGELRSEARPDPEATVRLAQEQMDPGAPELVFAHVLSPHEPYWFDDDCGFRSSPIHSDFDPARYAHQLECLNPLILDAVDAIVDVDPEAIIMLQSDHGSGVLTSPPRPLEDWSTDALSERYSIFEAMRFPDGCATPQGDHANVATFEYVLACIEGREPDPIEDRYFFWRRTAPGEVVEIDRPAPSETG